MRRRLDLSASIVVTPELMFLDEPTTGLDPRSRNQVWGIIRALAEEGTTILLCTQYLDEADQLAEGIAVIDHGKVIAEGTPSQLKASVGSGTLHVRLLEPDQRSEAAEILGRELGSREARARPGRALRGLRRRGPWRGGRRRARAARHRDRRLLRSASRAWTRSSWPSPGDPPRLTNRAPRRSKPHERYPSHATPPSRASRSRRSGRRSRRRLARRGRAPSRRSSPSAGAGS